MNRFLSVGLCLLLSMSLSCGSESTVEPDPPRATAVEIAPDSLSFDEVGGTAQLSATVYDQNGQEMSGAFVWWITSASEVATVDRDGVVTAHAMGTANIIGGSGSNQDTCSVSVAIYPPSITAVSLPFGVVETEYTQVLTATGGNGAYAWTIVGGALPDGLSLDQDGTISGTPTIAGTFTFTVRVTSAGKAATREMTLFVMSRWLYIPTMALASQVVGRSYNETLSAIGGDGTYTWSLGDGALPDGLTLSQAGVISGTPTAIGTYSFKVMATSGTQTAGRWLSITIVSGDLGLDLDADQFALIPAGTFQMGSEAGSRNERPVHTVNITQSFFMQKTEVTQAQWRAVMGYNPSHFSDCGDTCPVEMVSYFRIEEFLDALNAADPGKNYRLPTEAEWEYAARAGTIGDYGGTGNPDDMGWFVNNSEDRSHPVAQKNPNDWGLYDMHGNVDEFVSDWYSSTYYSTSPTDDPQGPTSGSYRVVRGGSWWLTALIGRSFDRSLGWPHSGGSQRGFRLVREQ